MTHAAAGELPKQVVPFVQVVRQVRKLMVMRVSHVRLAFSLEASTNRTALHVQLGKRLKEVERRPASSVVLVHTAAVMVFAMRVRKDITKIRSVVPIVWHVLSTHI